MVLAPSRALKSAREERGLSLRALSERVGLAYSTLSKLENGKMAITYDKLIRLSQGLGVDIHDLIAAPNQSPTSAAIGRRSVTRAGSEAEAVSEDHSHLFPAADLLGRKMVPVIINVRARSLDEAGGLFRHSGEEFLYVLNGSMELHSDLYAPLELGPGDSIYFDSGMAHAYVWTSKERCTILTVNTGPGIQRLADTAGTTWMVPRDEISRSD